MQTMPEQQPMQGPQAGSLVAASVRSTSISKSRRTWTSE